MIILRNVLEKNMTISEVAEKYGVHLNDMYNWKKKLFENKKKIMFSAEPIN